MVWVLPHTGDFTFIAHEQKRRPDIVLCPGKCKRDSVTFHLTTMLITIAYVNYGKIVTCKVADQLFLRIVVN